MKKKIFAIVLCVAMLAIAVIGGTMAYFTDTDAQTNTFTAGKVDISLDEAIVEKNAAGNLVATGSRTDETQTLQNYHLFPAMSITKDPTITVAADSEDAYIAAIVTITGDIYDLIGVAGYDNIDITKLASGGLMAKASTQVQGWNGLSMVYETDDCVIYQDADKANNTWTLYIFMKAAQVANAKVVLFDTLTIPAAWDNAEMAKINGMNIVVNAYATQTNGFADCYTAITTAFESAFAAVK
jgi:predicted ribosomally synthesized peptide with SipW-like signal peptide